MSERFYKIQDIERDKIMDAAQRWPAFKAEHPEAVNTTIGVIIDPNNDQPWQPQSVSAARIIAIGEAVLEGNFGYQAQAGNKAFLSAAKDMVFGEGISSSEDNRFAGLSDSGWYRHAKSV